MKVGSIHQTVNLPGSPREVYNALMTTKGHIAFTGADARISPRVGGKFMAWGGYIHGKNLTLIPNRTIYQTWIPSDPKWPEGHESRVRYSLVATSGGTRVTFTHTRVPVEHVGHLSAGWKKSIVHKLRAGSLAAG
ncbi:MAG: SRPBCC domain-containing protein [Thermoplasmata archaeon]